eukprot:CAMPEP_0113699036 /NCGR_PEP_ID=MMETSP0038_2-20120614/23065_1 /TAXON_ID=2898 /ORGANISM="Cryptomonas paramecium" /LENGTH=313 /DNA_ID=CAMNT_0000622311 /DNA_START=84 /DNA_END=1021 /DNA_ORIENTATION=- /assembly_acc=CAM_ASM_000170
MNCRNSASSSSLSAGQLGVLSSKAWAVGGLVISVSAFCFAANVKKGDLQQAYEIPLPLPTAPCQTSTFRMVCSPDESSATSVELKVDQIQVVEEQQTKAEDSVSAMPQELDPSKDDHELFIKADAEIILQKEIERLSKEREEIAAENAALRAALEEKKAIELTGPKVVLQDTLLEDDIRLRLEDLHAGRAAERIAALLREELAGPQPAGGTRSIGAGGIDEKLEPALFAGASADEARLRVKQLLAELDARTLAEAARLRELVHQAEDEAALELARAASEQLAEEEAELHRAMEQQAVRVRREAVEAMQAADAA